MKLIVGIDFGTSTTVVRYRVDGSDVIQTIKDKNGVSDIIPSVIFKQFDGRCLYGWEAIKRWHNDTEGDPIINFKMGLIDKNEKVRKEKAAYIEEFLKYVYGLFEQQTQRLNATEWDVYISYPAKWDSPSIQFMEEAVRKAGFSGNIQGKKEPEAAVVNHLHEYSNKIKGSGMLILNESINVLMLDMGAGTSDIVIFSLRINEQGKTIIEKQLPYPTVENPYLCGGSEIDVLLSEYVKDYLKRMNVKSYYDEDEDEDEDNLFKIYDVKMWKEDNLSSTLKENGVAYFPNNLKSSLHHMKNGKKADKEFTMRRYDFEEITKKHWENLYALISSAINEYKSKFDIGAEDIDMLLLTGAHSLWYTVNNLFNGEGVAGYIGKRDYKIGDTTIKALDFEKLKKESWRMFPDVLPNESVAKGLCVLDDQIEIHSTAPNNVWIQISIDKVSSEYYEIVGIGDKLPSASKINFEQTYRRNLVFGDCSFKVTIDVYTGETLESAKHNVMSYSLDENSVLGSVLVFILTLGTASFITVTYSFNVSMDLIMEENGKINLGGSIVTSVNDKKHEEMFTLDDFKIV